MTLSLNQLNEKISQLQTKIDQAEGRLAAHLETLQTEFGCGTLSEAEELLETWKKQNAKDEKRLERTLQELETEIEALQDQIE